MSANCRFCDSEFCIKHGFIRKQQRYFCKTCRRHFVLRPTFRGYPAQTKLRALQLLKQGLSYRAVAQTLAVSYTAVRNWSQEPALAIKRLVEEEMATQGRKIDIVTMDDLRHYSQNNAHHFAYALLLLLPQESFFSSKLILAGPS